MLKNARSVITEPISQSAVGPIKQIEALQKKATRRAYMGDVVGTGSSRKSSRPTPLVPWFAGDDIP